MGESDWKDLDKKLLSEKEIVDLKAKFNHATEYCIKAGYTDEEHQKKLKENSDRVASIRGGIINSMVDFEHFLSLFLGIYFSGMEKCTDFCEYILTQDFFTTYQKIKLFQRIGYHKQKKYKGKYDGLSGIMFKLNKLRNLVAHGTFFHFTKPELGFSYSGKSTHFDGDLAKKFKDAYEQVYYSLYMLDQDLKNEIFKKEYGHDKKAFKLSEK
jgi:hypothetical protein